MHSHQHEHSHSHDHGHHHHHQPTAADAANKAFIAGIVLNSIYVAVQAVMGLLTDSMALLSDAGHNLSDVASLILGLIALRLAKRKPTQQFTYGYKKTTILAALTNAVILLVAIGILGVESVKHIVHPEPIKGGIVAIVAAIGVAVNFGSAFLFFKNKEHDLNTKGAYMHLMADALVSVGVVVAGIVIKFTGWYWLDGVTSLIILIVILIGTWSLLTDSLRLTLDAVPTQIDTDRIEKAILKIQDVQSLHHIHIWAMSTTENALTAHLVLNEQLSFEEKMKRVQKIKHELLHLGIHHATIELESPGMPCGEDEIC